MSSLGAVAERYAQALFELGVESGSLRQLVQKINDFTVTYQSSPELRSVLRDPLVTKEQSQAVLRAVATKLQVPDWGIRGLLLMARRGRLIALPETALRLTQLCDGHEGVLRAHVATARQMTDSYYKEFADRLSAATKKRIILEKSVDASLVGGAIARVGDAVIDASVRGRLDQFEARVLSGLSARSS